MRIRTPQRGGLPEARSVAGSPCDLPAEGWVATHFMPRARRWTQKIVAGGSAQALAPLSAGGTRGPRLDEGGDLAGAETDLAQDLDAVLAKPRGQPADGSGGLAVDGRNAGQAHRPLGRVLDDLPEPDSVQVRIVEQRLERVDAHRRDVAAVEVGQPVGGRAVGRCRGGLAARR